MAVVVQGTFTTANTTAGLPNTETGNLAWSYSTPFSDTATAWGVSSNRAYAPSASGADVAHVNTTYSDNIKISLDLPSGLNAVDEAGIIFRYASRASYLKLLRGYPDQISVVQHIGTGDFNSLGAFTGLDYNNAIKISVILSGSSITVQQNDVTLGTITSSVNSTATRHGMSVGGQSAVFLDNFVIDTQGGGSSVAGGGTLTGTGTLSGSGSVSISKGANLTATGSLTAAGVTSISGAASLTAIGSLTAAGSTSSNPVAGGGTLSASGTLTATYAVSISAGGTLTGTTSLTAAGVPAISGRGTLTAVGSLSAAGIVQVFGATLTAFGSLTAAGQVSISGRASLQASGTMTTRGLTKDPVYVLSTIKLYGEMVRAVSLSGDIDSVTLSGERDLSVKLSGSFSSAKLGGGV